MKGATLLTVSAAVLLAFASASCPNLCSGHGTCGSNDLCTCFPNFQGLDCSGMTCPFQVGYADVASGDNEAHAYVECSGKGLCDRKSGVCKCFAGYTGEACRRTVCPNDCSGHGTCELMDEIAADPSGSAGASYTKWTRTAGGGTYVNGGVGNAARILTTWEAKKHQVCKCDPYWMGVDCSERQCPKGDDPLTENQVAEQQTVLLSDGDGADTGATPAEVIMTGFFTLTYTDKFNGVWTTRPIKGYDGVIACTGSDAGCSAANEISTTANVLNRAAKEMAAALNALPNQVLSGVVVTAATSATFKILYTITFDPNYNSGDQAELVCNFAGCDIDGCQPRFKGIGGGATPECTVTETVKGTTEEAFCSNRGDCDFATGLCVCHSGYYEEACQKQSTLV
jgi:hypothetical protein